MRVLLILAALAALALSVHNSLQLRQVRAEVAALRATGGASAAPAAGEARIRALVSQAAEHRDRAEQLIGKGDLQGARRELDKSLELTSEAEKARAGADPVAQIRDGAAGTARRIEDLVSRLRRKPEPGKPDPAGAGSGKP